MAMPELPEVEVIARGLVPVLVGQRLHRLAVSGKPMRSFAGRITPLKPLEGQRLLGLSRRAKTLIWTFEQHWLAIHLGMSGVLRWQPSPVENAPPAHCHLRCWWEHGELWFVDPRRFGDIRLARRPQGIHTPHDSPLPASLVGQAGQGWEPLSATLTPQAFAGSAKGVRQAIKVWLMKGDPLVGVGNIYASEALHRAGIHPARPAGRVSAARLHQLLQAIRAVLEEAIAAGGSTLRDYRHADGGTGQYAGAHRVYDRAGEPCPSCGQAIRRMVQAQRASFYCPACQR
jgi:formamidopyrimidine-DNA glycosylase